MKKLFLVLFISCVIGCSTYEEDKKKTDSENAITLASDGVLIGNLPDGRKIRAYTIKYPYNTSHVIYVVENSSSVSSNYHENKTINTISLVE